MSVPKPNTITPSNTNGSNDDWEQTLRKMAELGDLSTAASTGATMVSKKRDDMKKMVIAMTETIKTIKGQINKIKDEGNTAKKACKDLINNKYGPENEKVVKSIMENIKIMTNTSDLEKNILDMNSMVGRILQASSNSGFSDSGSSNSGSSNSSNPTDMSKQIATTASTSSAAANSKQKGGYTYGKSRRGKGKRRRRHKTHKKHRR